MKLSNSSKTFKNNGRNWNDFSWLVWNNESDRPDQTRPNPTRPWRCLTAYFSKNDIYRDVKLWHYLDQSLQFVLFKFEIYLFNSLKTIRFSATYPFRQFSADIFTITFYWRKMSDSDGFIGKSWVRSIGGNSILNLKKFFFIYKIRMFCFFFFELLQKFSDFVNFNYCIGKITSKSIRLQPVFIQKRFEF